MRTSSIGLLACFAMVSACTSTGHGTVKELQGENEASVKLGISGRVAPGDRVAVLQTLCQDRFPSTVEGGALDCRTKTVGHGVIVSLPDSRTAIIRADPGTDLSPGMFVRGEKRTAH